jgi:hypothetical protein
MRPWTASALKGFLDPPVVILKKGANKHVGPGILTTGFYIAPHCDPDCCGTLGISILSLGPFRSASAARTWPGDNLVAI